MKLHPHEARILRVLDKKSTPEEIAEKTELEKDAVMRALAWLSTKGLVNIREKVIEEITLGDEGEVYSKIGLPERRIIKILGKRGKIENLQDKLTKEEVTIGLGWLRRKGQGSLKNGIITITKKEKTPDEKLLQLIKKKERI